MNKYKLTIKNVGQAEKLIVIVDDKGNKRTAEFSTMKAAKEACFIIESLRTDSAFQYVRIVQVS